MRIPEIGPGELPKVKKTGSAAKPHAPQPAKSAHDSVEVGGDALLVSRLRTRLETTESADARQADLKQQLDRGTYEVDAREVARRLLGLE